MTRTKLSSLATAFYAIGAILGVPLGVLGLLVFLGMVTLEPMGPGMRMANGEITGKRTELAEARVGRQIQASEIFNLLAYRFEDEEGTMRSGEAKVGLLQFNSYVVGSFALIYYDPKHPEVVSIGGPVHQQPNLAGGIALMVLGWGGTLFFADRLLKKQGGHGWF